MGNQSNLGLKTPNIISYTIGSKGSLQETLAIFCSNGHSTGVL